MWQTVREENDKRIQDEHKTGKDRRKGKRRESFSEEKITKMLRYRKEYKIQK